MAGEIVAKIQAIRGKLQAVAEEAIAAVQEPILKDSQENVNVDTGLLKSTGKRLDPTTQGSVTTGVISYGGQETVKRANWHGVGYELFVHARNPFLEQASLNAKGTAANTMAEIWKSAFS